MRMYGTCWGASPLVPLVALSPYMEGRFMTDEQHQQQEMAPAKKELRATRTSLETLRTLPTPARPVVDPSAVMVPPGYVVEAIIVGLSFPCGMGFTDNGTLFILEGGSTWPTRPYMPARILRLDPSGTLEQFAVEVLGGQRGVAY